MNHNDFASLTALATASTGEHLTDRERQFIGLAVALTRGCIAWSGDRIARSRASARPPTP